MGIQDDVVKQLLFLVKYPCLVVCISVFFERIDFIGVALCGGGLLYDRTMSMFGKSVCWRGKFLHGYTNLVILCGTKVRIVAHDEAREGDSNCSIIQYRGKS